MQTALKYKDESSDCPQLGLADTGTEVKEESGDGCRDVPVRPGGGGNPNAELNAVLGDMGSPRKLVKKSNGKPF